jgi:hypothetical protein
MNTRLGLGTRKRLPEIYEFEKLSNIIFPKIAACCLLNKFLRKKHRRRFFGILAAAFEEVKPSMQE